MFFVPIPAGREKPVLNAEEPPPTLNVWPVFTQEVAAVGASGPNIIRIAAARPRDGEWRAVDLKEPHTGNIAPTIAGGVAAYHVGGHLYAYSSAVDRWEVAPLPNR